MITIDILFKHITHTDDFPSTGTRLVIVTCTELSFPSVVCNISPLSEGGSVCVSCPLSFCVRIMPPKFLFRSSIRGYLVNIITRVDIWYPGNK